MTFALMLTLRAGAPVIAALLACRLLRHRSAAHRHRVLAAAVFSAAAVLPLSVAVPSWRVPIATMPMPTLLSSGPASVPAPTATTASGAEVPDGSVPATAGSNGVAPSLDLVAFTVWMAGIAIGLGRLLLGVVRLVRLTAAAEPLADGRWRRLTHAVAASYGVRRAIALRITAAPDVLATWGWITPHVLLPAHAQAWSEQRAQVALRHEVAHISRCDWPVQITAELLRILFWFNPVFWVLPDRLRTEAEHACDDAVLGAGITGTAYASHLVDIAQASRRPVSSWVPVMSIVRPSTLERRVAAMLNTRLDRQSPTWRTTILAVLALACVVLPAASLSLSAQDAGPLPLTGRVYDSSGLVLPAVDVVLINEQQVRWATVTDGGGQFEFTPVGGGKYAIDATLPGFRPLRNEVTLQSASDWTRNITMQVGSLQETITVRAKRPVQRAAESGAAVAGPVRVGGNIKVPRKVKHAAPVYPAAMRDAGLEGVVPLDALIGLDGHVVSVRGVSAQVHPEFARAAEEAVRQWVFSPTLLNGVPVEVQMTVSIQFSLED
jgi:TonB family protein